MEEIQIRALSKSDIPTVLQLLEQVDILHHQNAPKLFRPPEDVAQKRQEMGELEAFLSDDALSYAAEDNGNVVGLISGKIRQVGSMLAPERLVGFVNIIVVSEDYQGSDVATLLMNHIETQFKSENVDDIGLNVAAFNQRAISFYDKMGFAPATQMMVKSCNKETL